MDAAPRIPGRFALAAGTIIDTTLTTVGGLKHVLNFPFHIWDNHGMSSFPLTNSIIFQRGRYTTNQSGSIGFSRKLGCLRGTGTKKNHLKPVVCDESESDAKSIKKAH